MITSEVSKKQLNTWYELWEEHKNILKPNRKNADSLITYLSARYDLTEFDDPKMKQVVAYNIEMNSCSAEKLPEGSSPKPRLFYVENQGNAIRFYVERKPVFSEIDRIIVGIDPESGCYYVEGSDVLWDELCAFQGLDEADLENFVSVGQYLECRMKYEEWTGQNGKKEKQEYKVRLHRRKKRKWFPYAAGIFLVLAAVAATVVISVKANAEKYIRVPYAQGTYAYIQGGASNGITKLEDEETEKLCGFLSEMKYTGREKETGPVTSYLYRITLRTKENDEEYSVYILSRDEIQINEYRYQLEEQIVLTQLWKYL